MDIARRHGQRLEGTLSLGTLATHTVVHAAQVIPVPAGADLSRVCLLGCGASTGVGAAVNTGRVWPEATVAVVGLGGIGLAALQGARIAGAARLIAVDLVPAKFEMARAMGATGTIDAGVDDPVAAVRPLPDDLDAMVSKEGRLTAEDIDEAFRAILVGEVVRTVIRIEPDPRPATAT